MIARDKAIQMPFHRAQSVHRDVLDEKLGRRN
jgi:hypothetical protein